VNGLKFKLQVITPLFLSGADQQGVELRPPSIRGALRFWFRAMMGGVVGGNLEKVSLLEAKVLGDTDQASRIGIRVDATLPPTRDWDFQARDNPGIVYLGYGLSGSRTSPRRVYVSPDSGDFKFCVTLSFQDESVGRVAIGAWWLLTEFGGLGARTRRGFGSIGVSQVVGKLPSGLQSLFTPPRGDIANWLRENLGLVRNSFAEFAGEDIQEPTDSLFPMITRNLWSCLVLDNSFDSWNEALNWIGQEFRKFREDRRRGQRTRTSSRGSFNYYISKDYDEAKKLLTSGQPPTRLQLPIFGLPLQFQFRSVNKTVRVAGEFHDRRSSPLHIRIQKKAQNYRIYLICFKSRFLMDQEGLRIEEVGNECNRPLLNVPSWQPLENFVNQFKGQKVMLERG